MIRRHASETTLLAHAAGTLADLHDRVLQVHLAACSSCREQVRQFEEIGGALLQGLPPVEMEGDALARTLTRLDNPAAPDTNFTSNGQSPVLAPSRWLWLGPGIRIKRLVRRDRTGTRLDLLRVAPGVALPSHTHSGNESVCVLQGSFHDESGHYGLHDFAEGDTDRLHQPVAEAGPDCICMIATTGTLRPGAWLARAIMRVADL